MWYSAEPFSWSSCDSAHVPISLFDPRMWIASDSDSAPSAREAKNRSISSGRIGPSW